MRRSWRSGAATGFACAMLIGSAIAARAQDLPRLHITALGMHADRSVVAPNDSYHITIHVHVAERLDRLDELQLPTLANAVDLGDERRRAAAPDGGTDFYEIMTVSSPDAGRASFSPAYIDAIDPRTDRGMRYSSQPLTVRIVAGAAAAAPPRPSGSEALDRVTRSLRELLGRVLAVGIPAVVLLVLLIAAFRRRPRRAAPAPSPPPPAPPPRAVPVVAPGEALRRAIAAFRASDDDATLDALRNVLFERAGAGPGSTLADALRVLGPANPALRHAMAIAERARFGPHAQRAGAVRDLFVALDALLAQPVHQ